MKYKKDRKQICLLKRNRTKVFITVLLLVFLFSKQINKGQYNFISEYIKIKVSDTSPPSIALDEVNASIENDDIAPLVESTLLKVGPSLLPQLELEEFVITELEHNAIFASPNLLNHLSVNSNIQNSGSRMVSSIDEESLTKDQLLRLQSAQSKYQVLDQSWNPPEVPEETLSEKIKRLNQQIVLEETSVQEKSGIIIKGDPDLLKRQKNEKGFPSSQSKNESIDSQNKPQNIAKNDFAIIHDDSNGIQSSSIKNNTVLGPSNRSIKISGHLEFARNSDPLLVLTPDHRIEVRRFAEGVPHEVGEVKPQKGTFSIDVQNSYGMIVAQLINSQGIIEGQDSVSIQDILKGKNEPHLVIKPNTKGVVSVSSAYGIRYEKDFSNSLNFDVFSSLESAISVGRELSLENRYADAESVVQVSAKGHVPTTAVISLQSGADLMLMPEKLIKGLTEILNEQGIKLNLERGDSLIWGIVRDKGQPVEGATIIAERTEPVYFGSMYLPDKNRTKTSDSGVFVIVVNEPGWKDLFIQLENGPKMHLNVLTFPGKLAQVFADLPDKDKPISVRSFDAFNGEPVRARVQLQQVEDLIDTGDKGLSVLPIPNTKTISFINIFPESPYLETRQSYSQILDFIHIPLIRREWLDKIKAQIRINSSIEKGTVIGFVQNEDFILIPSTAEQSNENLVYFNSNGDIVSSGSSGGGFVLFNQTLGFEGVSIKDRKKQSTYRKLAFPDEKFISILNFTL